MLDAPTVWTMSCDAGVAFSADHTCRPVKSTLPTIANTEHPHHNFWDGETVNYGCQSMFRTNGSAASAGSLCAACEADGQGHPIGGCKPIFVTIALVDNRVQFQGERAAYECQLGCMATGLAWCRTTIANACTARGLSPLQLLAEQCPVEFKSMSAESPRHLVRCSSSPLGL